MSLSTRRVFTALFTALVLFVGCKSAYYATWEKLGWAKRDILVDRVKDARDDQDAAKKQFKTTLERFQEVTSFQGGDLEAKYKKLKSEYDACEGRVNDVKKRIASVESVANDLFSEWKDEIKQYQSDELRHTSEQKLKDTKQRYNQLITVMKKAETKMDPVLKRFNDQVLFLKHNLNAQAIASLQTTAASVETDVSGLIRDMEASINEADDFIKQMK